LTEQASVVVQKIGVSIDYMAAFLNKFPDRANLPSSEITQREYPELRKPVLELSRALSTVQAGPGEQLYLLLRVDTIDKNSWRLKSESEDRQNRTK
jgi:hypothetical protein